MSYATVTNRKRWFAVMMELFRKGDTGKGYNTLIKVQQHYKQICNTLNTQHHEKDNSNRSSHV